ncbi:MAG: type II toxin-antitoxin system VapC family toxin, partial [Bradyrhizobium sp.]
ARLQRTGTRLTSPLAVWEAGVAVARVLNLSVSAAAEAVDGYLALMEIAVVAVPPETARIALDAFDRFGKGRHPASLNFGDCFAYACARHLGQPLMFKGGDFPQTDIEAA